MAAPWSAAMRDRLLLAGVALWALSIAPSLVPVLPAEATFTYANAYSDVAPLLFALALMLVAAHAALQRRERRFWLLLAGALGSILTVRAAYALSPNPSGVAFDLGQDLLYLGGYLLLALALERRPDRSPGLGARGRLEHLEVLGGLVFALGLLCYFVVIPSVFEPEVYSSWVPSLLLYAVVDAYLLLRVVTILSGSVAPEWVHPLRMLAAVFAVWLVADVVEGLLYLGVLPWIEPGTPADLLWHLPALGFIAVPRSRKWPVRPRWETEPEPVERLDSLSPTGSPLTAMVVALPALHLIFGLAGLRSPATTGPREVLIVVVLVALASVLAWHQHLVRRLTRTLEVDRQLVSEQLHTSQRMEAVGRLASGVAHDFSNILSVIRGRAELLLMGGRVTVDGNEDAREIVEAARRGQSLVTHLLTIGRRRSSEAEVLDLGHVVEDMRPLLERVLPDSIDLSFALDGEREPVVHADRAHLEQVVLNLVVNARDAMPEGGSMRVATATVDVDDAFAAMNGGQSGGEFTVLAVSDTGPGVPPDLRHLVFEPFFTTKDEDRGTGLGLSIVYGIARQARGWVRLTDAVGGGALFEVYFPRAHPRPVAARREEGRGTVGGRETILLVEDYEALRKTTARVLQQAGYRVLEAESAAEALAILERRNERVELLLADLVLPDLSGFELETRALRRVPDLSAVFISGYPEGVTPLRIPESAVILEKPFSPEVLTFTVRRRLDERKRFTG